MRKAGAELRTVLIALGMFSLVPACPMVGAQEVLVKQLTILNRKPGNECISI